MGKNIVIFDESGEVESIKLDGWSSHELKITGYCQVDENYWVIELNGSYYLTKTVPFKQIELS